MAAAQVSFFWSIIKDVFIYFQRKGQEKDENLISAHRVVNAAFIKTYDYLRNNAGAYVPKPDLAEAWNDASAAVMTVDKQLGDILYHKSRFWLDPDLYHRLRGEEEAITLTRVVEEMEKMRMKL